jgi:carboxylesterase
MINIDQMIRQARNDGVLHQSALPFLLEPAQPNGRSALLVHGFSASPEEMRIPAQHLFSQGWRVLAIRLKGHGTSPQELRHCQWQNWLESLEEGYELLAEGSSPVDLVGQSTGALLCLLLCRKREIRRLVLLSPFLKLAHRLAEHTRWLKYFQPWQRRELSLEQAQHYYADRPLAAIAQILRLRDTLLPQLALIQNPALVVAAAGDQTTAFGSAEQLFSLLGSREKFFHLLGPEVPHVLTTAENPELERTCRLISDFLSSCHEP